MNSRKPLNINMNKVSVFPRIQDRFLLSHLLIDRHFEHLIIFYGLEAEDESSIKLLRGIAPEGGLVPVGEVDTAAAARVEHSCSTYSSPSLLWYSCCCCFTPCNGATNHRCQLITLRGLYLPISDE